MGYEGLSTMGLKRIAKKWVWRGRIKLRVEKFSPVLFKHEDCTCMVDMNCIAWVKLIPMVLVSGSSERPRHMNITGKTIGCRGFVYS
ncbi:hypothetical protein PISMIDRAFT_690170 [Pisolithus microcarpus 441]|uniref:Unplaced genomic scaffold scaffold_495, whole genome shotgun sequence n=1 Tax=Pisolithus microcarpus 441 TaxID=765257 RepID=A0A0C9YN00_9AGAM|nr:hypothetical protein PISMIDRAFT_690170 [Pisolithus microcarpus 441]